VIRLAKPWIGEDEQRAVAAVLESGRLVQGPLVERFEHAVAALVGRKYAVAVSSGTVALDLALKAVGVQEGDEVLCPAMSWPSPGHAIVRRGAQIRWADIDALEWNSSPGSLGATRTAETQAAIVIDQFGNPVRADGVTRALAGLPIVEDAACALGSRFHHAPCATLGLVSTLSFHPRKIITTGEGGMCLTDDASIAERLRTLRNHGLRDGVFVEPASNARMTEFAAALGLSQLKRLDEIVARRRQLARRYQEGLAGRVDTQQAPDGAESNYQTFGIVLPDRFDRETTRRAMHDRDIETGLLSYAMHTLESLPAAHKPLPVTERIVAQGMALPLYPQMRNSDADLVIRALCEILDG
jgi:perosamine synthetase